MSKLSSKGQLTGAVGPVYTRVLNGRTIMQTKPGKGNVKQHVHTKQVASEFGRTSRAGKHIRMGLQGILQGWHDSMMFSRFTSRLHDVVKSDHTSEKGKRHLAAGDLSLLQGFEFNTASLFSDWSSMQPTVAHNDDHTLSISLHVPEGEAAVKPYPNASGYEAVVFVAVFDKETLMPKHEQFIYKYDPASDENNVTAWQTPVIPNDSIALVTVALCYYRQDGILGKKWLNNKGFHPCLLVGGVGV